MKTSLSLVVLAAGMWSRYWWLKQIDEFWPTGQSLLEYAIYDAVHAWFDHIVLVIREEFEEAFRDKFSAMLSAVPSYDFVYQSVPQGREKPRGTLQATLCARGVVKNSFAVVNADDRYWTQSYKLLANKLTATKSDEAYLVGYTMKNTLSDHGTVNRGVCHTTDWILIDVTERYALGKHDWAIVDRDGNEFTWEEIVSMNFWWFHQDFFKQSLPLLERFMKLNSESKKAEMVIPDAVDVLIHSHQITCKVLNSLDPWQWVTNAEDKARVASAFDTMHEEWVYPETLWS
jgi:dTDP-glucose pyrophosphorylase